MKRLLEKRYKLLLAVIMALAAMAAVWNRTGIFYGTNDDRVITEMLAGTVVQEPDPHVRLINWLLAAVICFLYRITGQIPWYGLCLILFQTVSWAVIFHAVLSCCRGRVETAAGIGLCCGCFLINLYSVGLIQFTSTAALMAAAGYVCLCLRQDRKGTWVFGGLELMAYFLRSDAMLMIQPLGGMVFLGLLYAADGERQERIKRMSQWAGTVAVILVTGAAGGLLGYHGKEWQEYEQYNRARIEMFDYYGTPAYEDVKGILDRHQVTRTEYEAYCNYVMLEGDISPECAEELAAYARERNSSGVGMAEAFRLSLFGDVYEDPLSGSRVMAVLWLGLAAHVILSGNLKMAAPLAGLGMARTVVWSYLFYRGRVLPRVTYPLIFCESVLLLALLVKSGCPRRRRWIRLFDLCLACVFLLLGYGAGQAQYRYVKAENEGQAVYIEGLREVREYCRQHSDRCFFLENASFSFYKGSALETEIYMPANGMYTGGWNANTPVLREYLQTYRGEAWENFYLIIYDAGEPVEVQAEDAVVRYFEEKSGGAPVLEERLTASHGGSYLIWHFMGPGP